MKIPPRNVARFLARPDEKIVAVLIFGPDGGMVRERAESLAVKVAGDTKDAFRVGTLTMAEIADEPGRLLEEAAALSLTGGRRVVRIAAAGDRLSGPLEAVLQSGAADALVVIEAGDLPARSSLRKLCETADNAAAIACYADDAETLEVLIESVLSQAGLAIDDDALDFLKTRLGGDRGVSRGELDKLVTYMGAKSKSVRLEDAEACIGDSSALSIDTMLDAVASGDSRALDRALERSLEMGESPVGLLRAAQRHLQRLHLGAGLLAQGMPADAVLNRLRVPRHPRRQQAMRDQLRRWPLARAQTALDLLLEAEIECKATGARADLLCRVALRRVANAARR
ncbi:MAG TPA: DNA polymerase III subunit delta [Candidatus Cybelea sp.]|nr:DNA polymerase III subunit delta [Candidatus Cybelea sp.]